MRNFKLKVYFKKDILIQPEIILVKNDYNSVEFDFEFDIEEGTKVFKLKKPDGTIFVKNIEDNKVVLVDFDETGNMVPVINQQGTYNFEIVCYDENSKITATQSGSFFARDEVVDVDNDKVSEDTRLPILDSLITDVEKLKNDTTEAIENTNKSSEYAKENGRYAKDVASDVENKLQKGELNGATFKPSVDNDGNLSWSNDKGLENPASTNIMGPQGPQGIQGEAFTIKKTYSSKEEMNRDFDNMQLGDYVMITSNVEVEDNAKLYSKGLEEWIFITDFSGATGIQGPQGIQGIQGIQGEKGDKGDKPVIGVDYFTEQDKKEMVDSITEDANSEFNQNVETKLNEYNENHDEKMGIYNSNHESKMQEYNENATTKVEEFNETVESLSDELDDCYKNQLVGQAEGTSIQVKDSADARMRALEIDGATKQETTTGKQLYDVQDYYIKDYADKVDEDGFITLSLDNSDGIKMKYDNYFTNVSSLLKVNTDYAVFVEIRNVSGNGRLNITSSDGNDANNGQSKNNITFLFNNLTNNSIIKRIFTTKEDFENSATMLRSYCAFDVGESGSITFRISVLEDTTMSSEDFVYEKFTGGQPSPNLDYPQEIENVNPYKNLLSNNCFNYLESYPKNFEKGIFSAINTTDDHRNWSSLDLQDFIVQTETGKYYTLMIEFIKRTSNSNAGVMIHDEDGNKLENMNYLTNKLEGETLNITFKATTNLTYFMFKIYDAQVRLSLNEGKVSNSYVQSEKYYLPLTITNKNLLVLNDTVISGSRNGIDYTWDGTKLTLNGTAAIKFDLYNFGNWGNTNKNSKRLLKPGTYTFSVQGADNYNKFTTNLYYDKQIIMNIWKETTESIKTLENDAYYSLFYIGIQEGATFNNETFYFQLEEGSNSTVYEPHQEDSIYIDLKENFVAKLTDDIKDTLRIENGHAILTKRIKKLIVDENSQILNNGISDSYNEFTIPVDGPMKNIPAEATFISSELFTTRGITASGRIRISVPHVFLNTNINSTFEERLTALKTKLQKRNDVMYYPLEESYEIDLGQVKLPKTFKGVSHIFLNANLETNMRVEYVKDTNIVIDNLSKAIVALGGGNNV